MSSTDAHSLEDFIETEIYYSVTVERKGALFKDLLKLLEPARDYIESTLQDYHLRDLEKDLYMSWRDIRGSMDLEKYLPAKTLHALEERHNVFPDNQWQVGRINQLLDSFGLGDWQLESESHYTEITFEQIEKLLRKIAEAMSSTQDRVDSLVQELTHTSHTARGLASFAQRFHNKVHAHIIARKKAEEAALEEKERAELARLKEKYEGVVT